MCVSVCVYGEDMKGWKVLSSHLKFKYTVTKEEIL